MQQRSSQASGRTSDPKRHEHTAVHVCPDQPKAQQRPRNVGKGNRGHRQLRAQLSSQQWCKKAADAEPRNRSNGPGQERDDKHSDVEEHQIFLKVI